MSGLTRSACEARDAADPLARFRDRFDLPAGLVYLDGNSLGAAPRATAARLEAVVRREWGGDLIRSWVANGWIDLPVRVGDKIARLVGAAPGEVIVADSTSVNLFKLLAAAVAMRPGRKTVLTEDGNFPTDVYVAQGLLGLLGGRVVLRRADAARLVDAIDDDTAVVMLTHVDYRSGRVHDLAAVTAAAHAKGALILWDLSHSTGAVPVALGAAGADLAVGCGYKYLNGGPGAPAFLYVARRHQDAARQPLSGWMGHARPFDFEDDYRPHAGIIRQLCGTPSVLAIAALEEGVDILLEADMAALRAKSVALTSLFIDLVDQECAGLGFAVASPREAARRGSQVALTHAHGYAIVQALIGRGVIGDFRTPDILRFGFAPLYVRHVDVWDAVATLREIMVAEAWNRPEFHVRAAVT
ncbi:MAG: kynureninase [Alphaproteobacteria bacterium]|nr:kynureninase [Alphaproteobacteria bacterium]